jgi:hypothetical protein
MSSTSQFAFLGSGTFSATQGFDTIKFLDASSAIFYDTTGAVEFLVDVAVFNKYIGITKDENYINLTSDTTSSTFYDSLNDTLAASSLQLTSSDVFNDIINNLQSIENVGKLKTLYSDFDVYTSAYFGLPNADPTTLGVGFSTLFDGAYDFDLSGGVFAKEQLKNILIPNAVNTLGASTSGISGNVTLANITSILRSAVSKNTFKNRNTYYGTTAGNPNDRANYGVTDGFMDGDVLFIPQDGFKVTLDLAILASSFSNNRGPELGSSTQTVYDASFGLPIKNIYDTSGNLVTAVYDGSGNLITMGSYPAFSEVTTASTSLIRRVVSVPLLIRLVNLQLPYLVRSILSTLASVTETSIPFEFRGSFDSLDISRFILGTDGFGSPVVSDITPLVTSSQGLVSVDGLTSSIHADSGNVWYSYVDTGLATGTKYGYTITPHLSTLAVTTGYPYTYEYTTI